ncbi:5'-nucleotidase C-terminal domain-containing protein [Flavobacteriaceae bacterium]|nr:5'-nucleotidase C-terminal domain-containing protein [Flavobacteriaceae bacterium]
MKKFLFLPLVILMWSCGNEPSPNSVQDPELETTEVVLFALNDMHGKIDRFSKVKPFIDEAKEVSDKVFFVSGGDVFSGNPIVDFHPEKGSPIIDVMGAVGMDVSVLGNHEFDYGQEVLNSRLAQATFPFICANVQNTGGFLATPDPYTIIEKDGFSIAFIGVVENSSRGDLPLSHPKNMDGLAFQQGADVVAGYRNNAQVLGADLVVALTHYGKEADRKLIDQSFNGSESFVDLVVGGHSHQLYNEVYRAVPMIQSGAHMQYLTKLVLQVADGKIVNKAYTLIDLSEDHPEDLAVANTIAAYNNRPEFYTTLATASHDHDRAETACFYTTALLEETGADLSIQNYGGVRANLAEGNIRPYDIYTIDPFGNGLETYSMKVSELKTFFQSQYSMAYAGLDIQREGNNILIRATVGGNVLADTTQLTIAVNDYISNTNPDNFQQLLKRYDFTTADYLISFLSKQETAIENDGCDRSLD